jgi:hypothetical protein
MTKEIVIINGTTGEQVQREMTAEELAEYDYRWRKPEELEAEAKAAADKAAATAKLEALGLTADDLKALGL